MGSRAPLPALPIHVPARPPGRPAAHAHARAPTHPLPRPAAAAHLPPAAAEAAAAAHDGAGRHAPLQPLYLLPGSYRAGSCAAGLVRHRLVFGRLVRGGGGAGKNQWARARADTLAARRAAAAAVGPHNRRARVGSRRCGRRRGRGRGGVRARWWGHARPREPSHPPPHSHGRRAWLAAAPPSPQPAARQRSARPPPATQRTRSPALPPPRRPPPPPPPPPPLRYPTIRGRRAHMSMTGSGGAGGEAGSKGWGRGANEEQQSWGDEPEERKRGGGRRERGAQVMGGRGGGRGVRSVASFAASLLAQGAGRDGGGAAIDARRGRPAAGRPDHAARRGSAALASARHGAALGREWAAGRGGIVAACRPCPAARCVVVLGDRNQVAVGRPWPRMYSILAGKRPWPK